MTKEELIEKAFEMSFSASRGDLQGFIEAQCMINPELDADEILDAVDEAAYLYNTRGQKW